MSRSMIAALLAAGALAPSLDARPELTVEERLYGLSLFWKEASYNFAYFDQVPELDWDAAYRRFVPRVLEAEDPFEYYRELLRFCALLDDGHTNVTLPNGLAARYMAFPAVDLDVVEGRPVVIAVAPPLADDLPPGSVIEEVDGWPVDELLEEEVLPLVSSSTEVTRVRTAVRGDRNGGYGLLAGPPGIPAALGIETPDGERRTVEVPREGGWPDASWTRLSPLPEPGTVVLAWPAEGIARVEVRTFDDDGVVPAFEALLPELRKARGIVLDLRLNGGGKTSNAVGVLRHFTTKPLAGSAWRSREHVAAYKAWGSLSETSRFRKYFEGDAWVSGDHGQLEPGEGPKLTVRTAVLIGPSTASAAEDFLVYADPLEHFVLVGSPSFGSTGQPLSLSLPGGGGARICTKRDTFPDGRDFVGSGVQPDVRVEPSLADVRAGRDVVLERALELLR